MNKIRTLDEFLKDDFFTIGGETVKVKTDKNYIWISIDPDGEVCLDGYITIDELWLIIYAFICRIQLEAQDLQAGEDRSLKQ